MKDEIKEILDKFKIVIRNDLDYMLRTHNCKVLLNYITNLQEENERLNNKLEKIKEIINYYAVENEDYGKIYNDEEKELLEVVEGDK